MREKRLAICDVMLAVGLFRAVCAVAAGGEIKTVETRIGHIRQGPGYEFPVVSTVPCGHSFEILARDDEWHRVAIPESPRTGWVTESQLTRRELILVPPDRATRKRLRSGELRVAARSFQAAVEQRLRTKQPNLERHFAWLDAHAEDPEFRPEAAALAEFRRAGGLAPLGGEGR